MDANGREPLRETVGFVGLGRMGWPMATNLREQVITGRYATGFAFGLLAKDVTIAAGLAESSDIEAPLCELVQRRWAEAAQALGFGADHSLAHREWWDADLSDAVPS